jgi:2-iminobutanoate/2-iminopropanoate deaminase
MRRAIRTRNAPQPAAAYEQAIVSGGLIFVSGQVASNPASGMIEATNIEQQVTQALRNVAAIVEAAGGTRASIVRCGVFLADLEDFAAMNKAYKRFFGSSLPARTTVQAGLGNLRVEIDAIAMVARPKRRPEKETGHDKTSIRSKATRK